MKIAVLSDIYGNLPALEAVTADIEMWQPEMTIVDGDVVNSGPCNRTCWQFVRKQQQASGWQAKISRVAYDREQTNDTCSR